MTRDQAAEILNKLFPGIKARAGYIGNVGVYGDDRSFRIFTNIGIGNDYWNKPQVLSINIPAGEVSAETLTRCVLQVLRYDSSQSVSCAVSQMLTAVQY